MQLFSITLFASTDDPEGVRYVDKSNWSGYGVVFNMEFFHLLKQEPGLSQAGTGKSMIKFKGAATAIAPIPRPDNSEINMQSSRSALRDKLLTAKNLNQVWA